MRIKLIAWAEPLAVLNGIGLDFKSWTRFDGRNRYRFETESGNEANRPNGFFFSLFLLFFFSNRRDVEGIEEKLLVIVVKRANNIFS